MQLSQSQTHFYNYISKEVSNSQRAFGLKDHEVTEILRLLAYDIEDSIPALLRTDAEDFYDQQTLNFFDKVSKHV